MIPILLSLLLSTASAVPPQSLICEVGISPFVIPSGSPFTVEWLLDATVPASPTDPTPVPNTVSGFYLQIDATARQDIGLPVPGPTCPAGTAYAGKIPYSFRTAAGVARGAHTATVIAWDFAKDANGNPTTTKLESAAASAPFVAADPFRVGPPTAPTGLRIRR